MPVQSPGKNQEKCKRLSRADFNILMQCKYMYIKAMQIYVYQCNANICILKPCKYMLFAITYRMTGK